MIAFLAFCTLTIAFFVGSVFISMCLRSRNRTKYRRGHQVVTLGQEAFIEEERAYKRRRDQFEVGMGECVQRVVGIGLGVVAVLVLIIVVFFNVVL